jgi:arginase
MCAKSIEILLVPWDVDRRDTPMARGPRGLLENGLPERLREAGWETQVTEVEAPGEADRLGIVTGIARGIAEGVERAVAAGRFPLILSGGCLASLGVVSGLQRRGHDVAAVWMDAHGDCNTPESSPSGYWDGMALAALCGLSLPEVREGVGLRPLDPDAVAHLAGRSFDPEESGNFERLGILRVPPEGIAGEEARERLRRCAKDRSLYLHVDVDGIDPRDAPAVGFPEPDGARLADLLGCRGALPPAAALTLSALSFDQVGPEAAARTVEACARLVLAFLSM